MTLAIPKLDDRQFQDIVDEAKKRIPHYCKEWTDHNLSDPGVTLIELFAWMTDIILYRLNQVPDLHYIKFMEMLGITLNGPVPASVPVTFWLSAPQTTPVMVPAGTEVSSTQTETERPVIFTTDIDARVQPPILAAITSRVTTNGGPAGGPKGGQKTFKEQNIHRLQAGFDGVETFTSMPQVDDALYFGFENDLSHHILGFQMDFDPAGGAGVDPTLPPYIWEASTGNTEAQWAQCDVEKDTTRGMNSTGEIVIYLPKLGRYKTAGNELYWVRARVKEISPAEYKQGMRPYRLSPRMCQVSTAALGVTVPATHAQKITREFLGQSDGSPGQRWQLKFMPVLDRKPGEHLVVQVEGEPPQAWTEVKDFASSGAEDRHYTLDSVSGEIRFGPAIRQQDGTIKMYGAVPPRRANLIIESYRYGGGQDGNVRVGILNTLKTSIPFIARTTNRAPASGGLDSETLESAMMRVPLVLRSRDRAVTESDFEFLARQALPTAIGRVKCLQPSPADAAHIIPGQVYVLVIPRMTEPEGYLDPEQLVLKEEDSAALSAYLDERRLLTTRLDIRPPAYQWVAVKVKLRPAPGVEKAQVEAEVRKRLYRFLNPLTGGTDGKGWPFGRDLFISDVYQSLQGIPNVQFIRGVEMYTVKPGGEAQGEAVESLEIVAHGVVASGKHTVEFV